MPIDLDIRDHETLGSIIVRAEKQALQGGIEEGLHKGELVVLSKVIEKRFGVCPSGRAKDYPASPLPNSIK
jgi:hypothetical protein